jgi:hypothetical protein
MRDTDDKQRFVAHACDLRTDPRLDQKHIAAKS